VANKSLRIIDPKAQFKTLLAKLVARGMIVGVCLFAPLGFKGMAFKVL